MANEVMGTLFGVTPEALLAERDRQAQAQALRVAQLDPLQQARYTGFMAANQLGNAVGGLLGAEDPELMRIRQRQSLLQGVDLADPAALRQAASTAMQGGDAPAAMQLAQRAMQVEEAMAKRASEQALVTQRNAAAAASLSEKLTPDQKNAAGLADTKFERGTPEWNNEYSTQLTRLTTKEGSKTSYGAEADRLSKALYGKDFRELTQQEAAKVDTELEKRGLNKASASASKPVDVAAIIREVGTKEDIKSKAEAWKQAGTAYTAQVPMIAKLDEVTEVLPKTFTGSFSEAQLQFGKALDAIGIKVDSNKLANTEYVNSVSSQVLQTIARSFPGSLAVKEMEQLIKSKFNAKQQLESMTRIIRDLRTELQAGVISYEKLSKLPETERFNKDLNFETGQTYRKLQRLNKLMDRATRNEITAKEREEAVKLQQELR